MELGKHAVVRNLDAVVESRHHQQSENGGGDGTADNRNRQWSIELAAFAEADCHWHHAGNQSEGGHQDRPQAHATGMHQRILAGGALRFFLARAVEQKDRVFGDQSHQHDDADEAHQVERAARQQQRHHHADQAQRQRQHHRQRSGERAKLDHQDQVHEADTHHQRDRHFRKQLFLVAPRAA